MELWINTSEKRTWLHVRSYVSSRKEYVTLLFIPPIPTQFQSSKIRSYRMTITVAQVCALTASLYVKPQLRSGCTAGKISCPQSSGCVWGFYGPYAQPNETWDSLDYCCWISVLAKADLGWYRLWNRPYCLTQLTPFTYFGSINLALDMLPLFVC